MLSHIRLMLVLVVSAVALAACDTAEERAEGHYQKGIELAEAGDVDRALVELRNVFQLNGTHRDARWLYAQLVEERGEIREAFGQLLRLIEQFPEDPEARVALTRLALERGMWDEVARHYAIAQNLTPDDPIVRSASLVLDYRTAIQERDQNATMSVAEAAAELAAEQPELFHVRRLVIDNLMRLQDLEPALTEVDAALEVRPMDRELLVLRLNILNRLGAEEELEKHLVRMTELFPDEQEVHLQLVRWYVAREETDKAEDYLRGRIAAQDGSDEAYLALVSFVQQTSGLEAARAELDAIIATEGTNTDLFRSARAGIDFQQGDRDAAIAEMESILENAEASDQTQRIRIALAQMLIQTDNAVGARALVEEVLADDATQVQALKLKANWLIDDDETGEAIVQLRRALDQSPQDPEIRTLLARAYERSGNRELMTEMLSLAVEVSGNAPEETIRYANVLLSENKLIPAETILLTSLRQQPQNPQLLALLGDAYLRLESWGQVEQVMSALNRIEGDQRPLAQSLSKELRARLLAAQKRETDLVDHLAALMEDGQLQAGASIVRLRLSQGDNVGALEYAQELLQEDPENPMLQFLEGLVLAANGRVDTATESFRNLLDETPQAENVWLALYNLHRSRGELEQASAVLQEAIDNVPNGVGVNWAIASELEFEGDVEGAIAIYEDLYARNTDSRAFANNLASLISSYRTDNESLQRAYTIARRLRGTEVPPYQDTYGWIAHLLGNHEEALTYLAPAAAAIPNDPLVRYHLGAVYAALSREEEARSEFEAALTLIEQNGVRREALAKVEAAMEALNAEPAEVTVEN